MGYTHYFYGHDFDPAAFEKLAEDAGQLQQSCQIPVAYEYDQPGRAAAFNPEYIRFNGIDDGGHETFAIRRTGGEDFNFCKTAAKPYDTLVCAVLLAAQYRLGESIRISSDGEWSDWSDGLNLYLSVFPERVPECPFEDDDE